MSLKNSRKGFTLIELLVVIAIIGILSSVVLASLSTARMKSRDAKRVSDIGQIQLALELFFDANQSYPSTTPTGSAGTATVQGAVALLATSKYIPQAPVPPAGGSAYYIYRGIRTGSGATALTECGGLGANDTTACTSYGLAVTLERTDNTVLTADADQTGATNGSMTSAGGAGANWAAYAGPTAATNVAGGGAFFGGSTDCTSGTVAAAATLPDGCYDIKP